MNTNDQLKSNRNKHYAPPTIEVINITIEQNILVNGSGDSNLTDMTGEYW